MEWNWVCNTKENAENAENAENGETVTAEMKKRENRMKCWGRN